VRTVNVHAPQLPGVLACVVAFALVVACGGAAAPSAPPSAPPATSSATASATAGSWTVSDRSKATVRVREQLVGVNAPSDAVLVATGAKGSFAMNNDGTFASSSNISFDLNTLTSDQSQRDSSVKRDPLQVTRFPTAEFVPTKTTGLTLPLPASGDFTFTLQGKMTIHGTAKDVTFDVVAKRSANELTATATANPTWKFGDFGMSPPSSPLRVISVTDEIKLVVDLVATLAS
jgi:polyisoprenoid-binding protein YceI